MSSLKEILERESVKRVSAKEKRTVRLMKMGGFLRAYDWSAWLLKRSGTSLKAGLDSSGNGNHLFVGFPQTSSAKFQPENCELKKSDNGSYEEWILSETQFPPEEDFDKLEEEFTAWYKEQTESLLAEKESKKQKQNERKEIAERTEGRQMNRDDHHVNDDYRSARPLRLTDIARQILQFQI